MSRHIFAAQRVCLRCFFRRQRCNCHALATKGYDFHLLPIVWEFLAAIEADHISTGSIGSRTAPSLFQGDRKTVVFMSAAKQRVQDPGEHPSTPTECRASLGALAGIYLLRFSFPLKGSSE